MNNEVSWRTFVYWLIAGMGLHIGWGLIALLVEAAAKSLGKA